MTSRIYAREEVARVLGSLGATFVPGTDYHDGIFIWAVPDGSGSHERTFNYDCPVAVLIRQLHEAGLIDEAEVDDPETFLEPRLSDD